MGIISNFAWGVTKVTLKVTAKTAGVTTVLAAKGTGKLVGAAVRNPGKALSKSPEEVRRVLSVGDARMDQIKRRNTAINDRSMWQNIASAVTGRQPELSQTLKQVKVVPMSFFGDMIHVGAWDSAANKFAVDIGGGQTIPLSQYLGRNGVWDADLIKQFAIDHPLEFAKIKGSLPKNVLPEGVE